MGRGSSSRGGDYSKSQKRAEDPIAQSDSIRVTVRSRNTALENHKPSKNVEHRTNGEADRIPTSSVAIKVKPEPVLASSLPTMRKRKVARNELVDSATLQEGEQPLTSQKPRRPRHKQSYREESDEESSTAVKPETIPAKKGTRAIKVDANDEQNQAVTKVIGRKRKTAVKQEAEEEAEPLPHDTEERPKASRKRKHKVEQDIDDLGQNQDEADQRKKVRRKRKTQEEKDAEAMPLAARTRGLRMFVGAHVSIAKGVENAVTNALHVGGNAFALFLQSQRKWENPELQETNREAFVKACSDNTYDASSHVLPHGSYLVNLAQADKERAKQAYDFFVGDLRRCESLGIKYYNFHPGATGQSPLSEATARLATQLNRALSEVKTVVPVLENMAGSGSVIGAKFSDLRDVIDLIKPEYKSRIGVCLDTCHAFAAGYDLRTPATYKKTMQEFDDTVGMKYLKGLHLNDSKAPFGSNRDLHQNIGLGFLGLRAFHNVMNDPRLQNLPLILETPCDRPDPSDPTGKKTFDDKSVWATEIKLLESLIGMDADGPVFKALEKELSDKGQTERAKLQKAYDEKIEKVKKKAEKQRGKGQKTLVGMMGKKTNTKAESPLLSDRESPLTSEPESPLSSGRRSPVN